jgi:hypothetical protein
MVFGSFPKEQNTDSSGTQSFAVQEFGSLKNQFSYNRSVRLQRGTVFGSFIKKNT